MSGLVKANMQIGDSATATQNSGSLLSVPITPTGTGRYLFLTIVYTTA